MDDGRAHEKTGLRHAQSDQGVGRRATSAMPALVLVSSRAEARSTHRSGVTCVPSSQDRADLRFRDRCTQQVRACPSVSPALGRANLIHLPVSSRGPNSPAFQGKEVLAKPVNHLHQYVASDGIATLSDDELAASIRAYDPTRTLSPSLAVWLVGEVLRQKRPDQGNVAIAATYIGPANGVPR